MLSLWQIFYYYVMDVNLKNLQNQKIYLPKQWKFQDLITVTIITDLTFYCYTAQKVSTIIMCLYMKFFDTHMYNYY